MKKEILTKKIRDILYKVVLISNEHRTVILNNISSYDLNRLRTIYALLKEALSNQDVLIKQAIKYNKNFFNDIKTAYSKGSKIVREDKEKNLKIKDEEELNSLLESLNSI